MDPIIEVRDVTFGYGKTPVLRAVNLHLHPGQFAGVVGPSGAGKTSLLRLTLGTLTPSRGEVWVAGKPLKGRPAPRVSYVPQVETIDWSFPVTVEQVVLMGRVRQSRLWPWPSRSDRTAVAEVLERLQIGELRHNHIRNLSGGQQQRVFLARALIAQPDLLVLDEPTSGVDMQTAEKMLHLLLDLNRHGMTILMTTHDLNMAAAHIPWIVCLNRSVIAQGEPADVFTSEILSETYRGAMQVTRHDGTLLIYQKPHRHKLADVVVDPVLGHAEALAEPQAEVEEGADVRVIA
jgi:zinc/manganese transport system ATP-binding protein/zinc transport system ATP-binding protein